jgi:anthranilate synthase component I
MQSNPALDGFSLTYDAGKPQVMWTTFIADLDTPVSAILKLADNRPNSFLFESVEGGKIRGRYSFIGLNPDLIWRCHGSKAEINRNALDGEDAYEPCTGDVLDSLRALHVESAIDLPQHLPPMAAGLIGYMSYDTVRLMEHLPNVNPDTLGLPDGMFLRPTVIAIFDNIEDTVTIVTPVRPQDGQNAVDAYHLGSERLSNVLADFSLPVSHDDQARVPQAEKPIPVSNMSHDTFCKMVERAKEYILAGDIFQVVLSQRFAVPFELPPFSLYRALRRLNPSPFLVYLNFGHFSIVGSSPEILVRLREGKVTVRPIAGTRPRGANETEDRALAEDLLADPKELAEHLMLLDLGRNDVGRVADIGSVEVTEKMKIELYSHVMHIVSNVEGSIASQHDALAALIAGFPAGTVSGAPKVRAMEIIDELETEKRGVYAGCIGYLGANGDMDTCIALRTAVVKDGTMYVQAGGGIVADSDPHLEFEESQNKARALIRAAEEAVGEASGNR